MMKSSILLLLTFSMIMHCESSIIMPATVCVLNNNSQANGQELQDILQLSDDFKLTIMLLDEDVFYNFKIISCDIHYYNDLFSKYETSVPNTNNESKAFHLNPVFVTNIYSYSNDATTIKPLLAKNYFAHLWNLVGKIVLFPFDVQPIQINDYLKQIAELTNIPRGKLLVKGDIWVSNPDELNDKLCEWFENWQIIDTYSDITFDSDTMVMFKNSKTNQELVLFTDFHMYQNKNHLKFYKHWQPSLTLIESEPWLNVVNHMTRRDAKVSVNTLDAMGNVACLSCACCAACLSKNKLVKTGLITLGYAVKLCTLMASTEKRSHGLNFLEIIDTLKQNSVNSSIVFADWKDYNQWNIGLYDLYKYLDEITKRYCSNVDDSHFVKAPNQTFYGIHVKHLFSLGLYKRKSVKTINLMKECLLGEQQWNQRYETNQFWEINTRRSSIIWQHLFGLTKPEFVNDKRIVGVFGGAHVIDIVNWSRNKNMDTFYPLSF